MLNLECKEIATRKNNQRKSKWSVRTQIKSGKNIKILTPNQMIN